MVRNVGNIAASDSLALFTTLQGDGDEAESLLNLSLDILKTTLMITRV